MAILKVGVLISGRGTNLQALIEACAAPSFPAEIALVISNVPDARGIELANAHGIATVAIDHKRFDDRSSFELELIDALEAANVSFVCLAGFMRLLTPTFVTHWLDRLINIHPSLLPAFPGLDTHRRAIDSGARFGGCTVHFVRAEMDNGPIIIQAAVPIRPDDNADTLGLRVLRAEHICYPHALRLIAEGRTRIRGNLVEIEESAALEGAVFNPPIA